MSPARIALREQFEQRLRAVLLEEGHVDTASMEEALARQVVQGGHLATNLWELGLVDGRVLTRLSCALLGLQPVMPGRVLHADRETLRLIPVDLVERGQMLPFAEEGATLLVAMPEPWDLGILEEAQHATGRPIKPFFLGEVPMAKVLGRVLGRPIAARFELGRQLVARRAPPAPEPAAELMSEDAFNALYAGLDSRDASGTEADLPPEPVLIRGEPVAAPEPLTALADLAEAQQALEAAAGRDEVGEVLARFALSKGERAALFVLHETHWAGWTGAGAGIDRHRLASMMLPAEAGSVFGLVASTGAHFLGPLADHSIHRRFLEGLGGLQPHSVGLFPVHYRGRVVFGLYLDGGDAAHLSPDIADILLLAQRVPVVLEALVARRLGRGVG